MYAKMQVGRNMKPASITFKTTPEIKKALEKLADGKNRHVVDLLR
jgi:predicted transcriptional regulator